ncbi:sensor histidine kinase [Nocardioides koreensis]|uniref:sensor histidine kinase n=1 Tax=Nocardioides koreensis TaxID=433651 RepID=UPI0031DD2FFC
MTAPEQDSDSLSIAVLDRAGVIVGVNEQWQRFCLDNGGDPDACGIGASYLDVCAAAGDDPVARYAVSMIRKALLGELSTPATVLTPCAAPGTTGWFDMRVVSRIDDSGACEGALVCFSERLDLGRLRPRTNGSSLPSPTRPEPMSTTVADPRELLTFPDVPRLELEETLTQLTERAADVLKAQGRLRELLRANALVTADLKLEVVLRRVVHAARDLVGAKYAALGVLGEDGLLDQFVHAGMPPEQIDHLGRPPVGEGILGLLVDEPGPVRLRDVSIDPRAIGFPGGHPAMTSFLGVPIRVRGTVFGNLYLTDSERGEFSDEDEQLVTSLARTAAVAIENARLYEDSERRRRWQGVTTDATQALFAGGNDRPLHVVLEGARQGAEADAAIFADLDDEDVVTAEIVVGELAEELTGRNAHAKLSTLEPVLRHGTPLLIESYRRREVDPPLEIPIASLIAVPMLRGQRVVGAVVALRFQGRRPFDHTDVEQLEAYVGHAAVALELNQSRADQEALAVLREHQRIAADLHDHVIQELFATGMALQGMVYRTEDPRDQANLVEFVDAIDATIRRIRTTIFRLNRAPYGGGSLKERLLSVVEDARPALGFTAHAEFSGPLDQAVPEELADHVVAVAREALSNAARHAAARSVRLRVTLAEELLTLDAIDDGRGIGTPTRSSGLANLERRAKECDGTLEILDRDGGGTHLRWTAVVRYDR